MANDLPDWSSAVQVVGGVTINGTATVAISGTPTVNIAAGQSVSITGTPSVTISGTPAVTISGTPSVQIATGSNVIGSVSAVNSTVTVAGVVAISGTTSVSISGTPTVNIGTVSGTVTIAGTATVTISGTPTVVIGAGSNVIGSIDAVNSTVTVAGTVNIGNTPAVTISGTPTVNIGTVSGTVTIAGTATVTISGTPTVVLGTGSNVIGSVSAVNSTVTVAGTINIGNTPSVTISGTPAVTISSGTVSISGTASINIVAQSITVNTQKPVVLLSTLNPNATTTSYTFSPQSLGCHAIGLRLFKGAGGGTPTNLTVKEGSDARKMLDIDNPAGAYYVVPVPPDQTSQVVVSLTTTGGAFSVDIFGLLEPQSVFISNANDAPAVTKPGRYSGSGTHAPAAAAKATITLAANATKRWVAHHVSMSMATSAATFNSVDVQLIDGVSGGAAKLWISNLMTAATIGSNSRDGATGLAIGGAAINTAMTLEFTAAGAAGCNERVNLGAYLAWD